MAKAKTILLADDDPHDVALTLRALSSYKMANQVVVAEDGVKALDYLLLRDSFADREPGNPALVLLDRKMPRLDGIEVLREIRLNNALKHLAVVMLTSSREDKDILESYNLGINAYVVKPVDFHAFVEAVQNIAQFWLLLNETP